MDTVHPLKAFRKKQKPPLTQGQLAVLLEVSRATVNRWETCAREIDEDKLLVVAEKTGIPPRDLRPDLARLLDSAPEGAAS